MKSTIGGRGLVDSGIRERLGLCPHRWRTQVRGQGHEHECAALIQDGVPHECRCCCGALDLDQWDLPARKTPGLKRSA